MVSGGLKLTERVANLPHSDTRGNRHGESIMIDPLSRMNQIATAFAHDKKRERAARKGRPPGGIS
jgi:hypothetical protein